MVCTRHRNSADRLIHHDVNLIMVLKLHRFDSFLTVVGNIFGVEKKSNHADMNTQTCDAFS